MGKKIIFLLTSLLFVWVTNAQDTVLKGIVTDSVTGEGLPFVSIIFRGTTMGTATDGDGNFSFSARTNVRQVDFSYLGYDTKTIEVVPGKMNNLKIELLIRG